ncbi:hypothetical protein A2U01_0051811 [Trifolium medium]|uniref:Uncharacterized protein n=1 Tax=Trifolium medium TaxID=97028 RepID=A0A392R211_9FABA|nr:hypothetical protein [Trifolium medium]
MKAEEEKKKAEEEEEKKRQEAEKEAEEKNKPSEDHAEGSVKVIEASEQVVLDKGKAIMDSEPPAYVLKMQADIESQRIKQEALEQKADKVAEIQHEMSSKLDALISLLSKKT